MSNSSVYARTLSVLSVFSAHDDATNARIAREFATEYGRAEAAGHRKDGKLTGAVKAGQATVKDGSGLLMPATPVVRFVIACGILRDAADKVESSKGAYGFKVASHARIECPGLARALEPDASPINVPAIAGE